VKYKRSLFFVIVLVFACALFACSRQVPQAQILTDDEYLDVATGEYTLLYSVKDVEKLASSYDLRLTVRCIDESGAEVSVKNNRRINIEADKIYYVTINVTLSNGRNSSESQRTFSVHAVKTPPSVEFVLLDRNGYFTIFTDLAINLTYGADVILSDLPEVPDHIPSHTEAEVIEIKNKFWAVYENGVYREVIQNDLNNVTKKIRLYATFDYDIHFTELTVTYVTNGGTEIPPLSAPMGTNLTAPDRPVLDGFTFDAWCVDADLTSVFPWPDATLYNSLTLYARYVSEISQPNDNLFNFLLRTDNDGNPYYYIELKPLVSVPSSVVIPKAKDNIPVRQTAFGLFEGASNLETVFVPQTISLFDNRTFYNCAALREVIFEENGRLTNIPTETFLGCVNLTSVNIPDTVTEISQAAFKNCEELSEIILPEGIDQIRPDAFKNTKITEISLPERLKERFGEEFEGIKILYY